MVRISITELKKYLNKKSIIKPSIPPGIKEQSVDFGLRARRTSRNLQRCGC